MQEHGLQCGFCTPGMITRATGCSKRIPTRQMRDVRYWMAGNLCRCTGYQNIRQGNSVCGSQAPAARPVETSHPLMETSEPAAA